MSFRIISVDSCFVLTVLQDTLLTAGQMTHSVSLFPSQPALLLWMLENQMNGFRIDTCRQQCWTHTFPRLGCEFATYSAAPKATELLSARQADGSAAQTHSLCFLWKALEKQHIQSFVWFTYFRKHSIIRGIYNRYFSVQGFRKAQS